ncbi:MAG: class I SAM-dependent methyltransferase [Patescibacteria group bacterium]
MFGSNYANYPEILRRSLREMNHMYRKELYPPLFQKLQSVYIRLFGIPEIGFQIRSLNFQKCLNNLRNFDPKMILDAGSGIGAYVFYLAQRFPKAQVVGLEIDKQKVIFATKLKKEQNINNVQFVHGDVRQRRSVNDKYDLIVSIDVLEHIDNYEKVIKNFSKLLKPRGVLYIHAPHKKQKRFFAQFRSWRHGDHLRVGFDLPRLKEILAQTGLKVSYLGYTFGFWGSLAWELNHLFLSRNLILAGVIYPFIYLLALVDTRFRHQSGLGIAILAQK